jgi:uncharacterized protein YecE (DUF72 family)
MGLLKIGCCGFPLLKIPYAERFPVVEVQQTFYQPPMRTSTLENWRTLLPFPFEFTLKAWQLITHTADSPTFRRLKIKLTPEELGQCGAFQWTPVVRQAWEKTRDCARALEARLVLFQCPASFRPEPHNLDQMRRFFNSIDRDELILLWEPRGNWDKTLIRTMCRDLNLVHAVDPFVSQSFTPDLIYFRLHGGKNFRHVFSGDELLSLARLIPENKTAYVMFNNLNMLEDAQKFQMQEQSFPFLHP